MLNRDLTNRTPTKKTAIKASSPEVHLGEKQVVLSEGHVMSELKNLVHLLAEKKSS